MRTLAKTASRPNYLFSLLPQYFKENDSYKDGNGDGLLERYLEIFCAEVDSQVVPYIDNVHYLLDAENLASLPNSDPSKFLDYLSELFGNPPYLGTEDQYKALIKHIVWILKTKGTRESVELFLNLWGYTIYSFNEEVLVDKKYDVSPTPLKYDSGHTYDNDYYFYSSWDITITDMPGTGTKSPTSTWLNNLKLAIQKFLAPIFAILANVFYTAAAYTYVTSGVISYRKRTIGGYYLIDFSEDSGETWELGIVVLDATEDSIIITIDSNPAGYRQEVRGRNYYIDHELTPTGFGGVEGTDWETIYMIEK